MYLALVVGSTASKKIAVAHRRFERRRRPEIERLGRLHIIVAIEENRWLTRSFQRLGVYERMEIRGHDFNRFKSSGAQMVGNPARSALDIRLVLGFGTDTGDA